MSKNPKNDIFKLPDKLENISNNPELEKNTGRNNLVNFTMRLLENIYSKNLTLGEAVNIFQEWHKRYLDNIEHTHIRHIKLP